MHAKNRLLLNSQSDSWLTSFLKSFFKTCTRNMIWLNNKPDSIFYPKTQREKQYFAILRLYVYSQNHEYKLSVVKSLLFTLPLKPFNGKCRTSEIVFGSTNLAHWNRHFWYSISFIFLLLKQRKYHNTQQKRGRSSRFLFFSEEVRHSS